ncbi:hypothetical protein [Coralloluteibacterium thermophilus]|uniref:DUF2892 domain-containing protein n=1 Tax=Coralloluteibacterium thermophilum TaxID=2707049 RepID=A0ABV9NFG8_9GAMM
MTRLEARIGVRGALIAVCLLIVLVAGIDGRPWFALLAFLGALSASVELVSALYTLSRARRRHHPRPRAAH